MGQTPLTSSENVPPNDHPITDPGATIRPGASPPGSTRIEQGEATRKTLLAPQATSPGVPQSPPAADALPHQQIGQYMLLEKLGQGGMGAVYKAKHLHLNKLVAIKLLALNKTNDPDSVSRFEREMRAVGKLQHPNIVIAHDAGEWQGCHFLAMELIEGHDLRSISRKFGPLPIPTACELIRQVAVGLQHAHEFGLVHRDIKPANLMLAKPASGLHPVVKILDLGLALLDEATSREEELTTTGQVMGTIEYMAPEQASDTHAVDTRADVYSLGATLYRLISGRSPLNLSEKQSLMKRLNALANEKPVDVRKLRPECPEQLAALLNRLLSKNPADRPFPPIKLAKELAPFCKGADLRGLLNGKLQKADGAVGALGQATAASYSAGSPWKDVVTRFTSMGRGGGKRNRWKIAGAAAAGAFLLGAILIIITSKDRTETRVQVPEGAQVQFASIPDAMTAPPGEKGSAFEAPNQSLPAEQPTSAASSDPLRHAVWEFTQAGGHTQISTGRSMHSLRSITDFDRLRLTEKNLGLNFVGFSDVKNISRAIEAISHLDSIGAISFYKTNVNDSDLQVLTGVPIRNSMLFYRTNVTAKGLLHFANKPQKLRTLHLNSIALTTEDLMSIATGFPELRLLQCPGVETTSALPKALAGFPQLRTVMLRGEHCTLEFMSMLRETCPRILEIGLNGKIVAENMHAIRSNPFIKGVLFDNESQPAPDVFPPLKDLRQLDRVCLYRPFNEPEWTALTQNLSQPELWFCKMWEPQQQLERLAEVESLKLLHFSESAYSPKAVDRLHDLRADIKIADNWKLLKASSVEVALDRLNSKAARWILSAGGKVDVKLLNGAILHFIQDESVLPNEPYRVAGINLTGCQITKDGLKLIAGLKTIHDLELDKTNLDDAGLDILESLERLSVLRVRDTKVTEAGLVRFFSRDRRTRAISTIGIPLSSQALSKISLASSNINALDIDRITGNEPLSTSLAGFPNLTKLTINAQTITPELLQDLKTQCPKIYGLVFIGDVTPSVVRQLKLHPGIRSVSFIAAANFNSDSLSALMDVPSVTMVSLGRALNDSEMSALIQCSAVESVMYYRPVAPQPRLDSLAKMPSLKRLTIIGVDVDKAEVDSIAKQRPDISISLSEQKWVPPVSPKGTSAEGQ